jgi:hypothetical protein
MANRVSIYGTAGDKSTAQLRREMASMALTYDFYDIVKQPQALTRLKELGAGDEQFPKVEVVCANSPGCVIMTNPDVATLRQTLYAEEVLGVTSYWV